MRGLELMLMSIYAMQNGTNYTENRQIDNNGNDYISELGPLAEASQDSQPTPIPKHFTVTTWQNMPYSNYSCNNGTCEGFGYAFDLLKMLQEQLHFTYTLIPPKESKLGDKNSGMMGQLYNKEVDMAIAFIPLLPELAELCTFSTIMDEIEVTFLMKRPRESATGSGLLAPFSTTVWYCILISLIVVGPVIYVLLFIRFGSNSSRMECQ